MRALEGIDQVMKAHQLDALVAPTGGPAWLTDFINGDHFTGSFLVAGSGGGLSAHHGAGRVCAWLAGRAVVCRRGVQRGGLIRMAYSYEQATMHRRAPMFPASVSLAVR
jgi:amidase